MILQNDLKWNKHINHIINKLNSRIPLYYQLRNVLPKDKRILMYKSLSMSNIIYGIELYGKSETQWIKLLQKTQNRLLKILFNINKRFSINSLH